MSMRAVISASVISQNTVIFSFERKVWVLFCYQLCFVAAVLIYLIPTNLYGFQTTLVSSVINFQSAIYILLTA